MFKILKGSEIDNFSPRRYEVQILFGKKWSASKDMCFRSLDTATAIATRKVDEGVLPEKIRIVDSMS